MRHFGAKAAVLGLPNDVMGAVVAVVFDYLVKANPGSTEVKIDVHRWDEGYGDVLPGGFVFGSAL